MMALDLPAGTAHAPDDVAMTLARCQRDHLPPNIALMHMILAARSPGDIDRALAAPEGQGRYLRTVQALWEDTPGAFATVKALAATVRHSADTQEGAAAVLARFRASFDRAVALDPVGSVALYTLGRDDLHDAITRHVAALLHDLGLLSPAPDAVELGCGTGRLARLLADHWRSYCGLDLSLGMVTEARRLAGPGTAMQFSVATGRDLRPVGDGSASLVLAIDVFPYLALAGGGLSALMLAEVARVLRPGGRACIINFAYDLPAEAETAILAGEAAMAGLELQSAGPARLPLWDARLFTLRRPATFPPG
jgi:SAM-dependent methyltransferase